MPVIAEDVIRSLVGFRGERAPVTSCYLDVDGRRYVRHQDLEHEVGVLLHRTSILTSAVRGRTVLMPTFLKQLLRLGTKPLDRTRATQSARPIGLASGDAVLATARVCKQANHIVRFTVGDQRNA